MTGSGGCCDRGQRGEVTKTRFVVACDTHLPSLHSKGSWCDNSATFSVSNCQRKSRQKQRQLHRQSTQSSSHILAQKWTLGLRPCANSLHNSLWYFIITVLILSKSLLVSAQDSYTRRPSNGRVVLGQDYTFRCAFSNRSRTLLWLKGSAVLFIGSGKQTNTPDSYSLVNGSDLKLTGVTIEHSGRYSCQADGAPPQYGELEVLVAPGLPVISLDTSSSGLTEGDSLTLTCSTSGGNPSPVIVWKKNGTDVSGGSTTTGPNPGDPTSSELTRQLDWTDHQAVYSCEAFNEVNRDQPVKAEQTLLVRYLPRISFSPYNGPSYFTVLGQRVTLKCEVNAYPSTGLDFQWTKDGALRLQRSDTLLFPSIEKTDAGEYTCGVYNGFGQRKNKTVTLDVQYAPEIVDLPRRLIVNDSDTVNLTCKSNANPPAEVPMWRNSRDNNKHVVTWLISSVTKEDADNYTCVVTNILTPTGTAHTQKTTEKTVEVLVQYLPGPPTFEPINTHNIGDKVELTCLLPDPGYPAGTYEWQKGQESTISTGQVYTIALAALSDSGTYRCRGRNLLGTGPWAAMALIIYEPPRFVSTLPSSKNVTVTERNYQLQCQVRGRPQPDIQWKKNGIPFDQGGDGDFYQIKEDPVQQVDTYSYIVTSKLLFKGFKRLHRIDGREDLLLMDDTANYTCASGNDLSQTIQIFVQYPPAVTVTPPKVAQDFESTVTFSCLARANPEPHFQWYFNNVELNSVDKYRIQSGGRGSKDYEYMSILTVTGIVREDLGEYNCTATNALGTNFNIANIVTKSKPEASTDLRALDQSWTSIYLQWNPGFNGGEDQTFVVYYKSDKNEGSYEALKDSFNITGLLPSTSYILTVAGKNGFGLGPESVPLNASTRFYNFTVPSAVKFDKASNTLSFDEPGSGYFAKVEIIVSNDKGWEIAEEKANTEGGSIKLQQKNIKEARVSFCVENQPQACSAPVEAEPVEGETKTKNGDLSTEGVVIIACVCAVIIIGLCIALFCVIRRRKQDKAAKDYELETQANRRSQPINNPKDIAPKRGYDNPDFASHQIQRNGHVSPTPIANGKPHHYKPPMNMENSFESRDIQKYDEYDSNRHPSYGDEPLNFIPYSSLYYTQGDPYYNTDGPREYMDRPPSNLKDPSVSGQESGYSTPEPTKPKKVIYEVVV